MEDKKIWDYLFSKIGNPYGVSALMGNLYVESKLNPMDLEGTYSRKFGMTDEEYTKAVDNGSYSKDTFINDHAGYGLAQWTYWSRKEALYDYAKSTGASIGDLYMQLDYLWDELQKYKTVLNALYNAKSIREASDVVVLRYEKPQHTEETFLQNRANYGQKFYDKFAGGDCVYTAKQVDEMLNYWLGQGLPKPEVVVKLANACLGWNYIFGDRGEYCTPSHVKSRISSLAQSHPSNSEALKKKCQITNGSGKTSCNGCRFYPDGETRAYDCRGFTYWCFLKGAGITIEGAGATSQYNNNNNWSEKGLIANMPKDKVCCVFRYDSSKRTYEHTLIYDGEGHYIHCSSEVKKCDASKYKATHYAIPKGLYGGDIPVSYKAKVYASSGSTVNMRASASASSAVIVQVPIGTIVDVKENKGDWSKIVYDNKTGYMMSKFLQAIDSTPAQPTEPVSTDMISVKKSDLEQIYTMIGKMLGK